MKFHLYNDKENPIHKHKDVSNHEDYYKSNNSEIWSFDMNI